MFRNQLHKVIRQWEKKEKKKQVEMSRVDTKMNKEGGHFPIFMASCLREDPNHKISVLRNQNEDFRVNSVAGMWH